MNARDLVNWSLRLTPWYVRRLIRRLPGIAHMQRAIVSRALDGKEFIHTVDAGPAKAVRFKIRMPEDKGIWTGTYEAEFAQQIAKAVRPGVIAYDIGSWHGFFAGVMAAHGAEVHVFEPLPENAERIRSVIGLNPDKKISLHTCAVGDHDTKMELIVMPETSMAKLERSSFQPASRSAGRVRVEVRSIDSLVAAGEAAPPGLLKIDVEGAEMMVLEGGRVTIARYRPEIFAEVHSSVLLEQCSGLLRSEGYQVRALDLDQKTARERDVFQIHAIAANS